MTDNKMSKRSFLKLALSTLTFLSIGGLSFLIPNKLKDETLSKAGYGRGGYGN